MARPFTRPKIDTPTARKRLPVAKAAYWWPLGKGLALGYRKGLKGGSWVAKYVRDGRRKEKGLGDADDGHKVKADGGVFLSFDDASDAARAWFISEGRAAQGLSVNVEGYTVKDAVDEYLEWFGQHKKSLDDTRRTINAHILPEFGPRKVASINAKELRSWHAKLAETRPRLRTGKDSDTIAYRDNSDDPDAPRRRKATANRILTVLRAILTRAFNEGRVADDSEWRRVQPFARVEKARIDLLQPAEWKRLLTACPADFRVLVNAALLTGARYGELAALRAYDFDRQTKTINISASKSGEARKVFLTDEGVTFFARIVRGKKRDARLFTHGDDALPWGKSHQIRPMADACKKAKLRPMGFHALRHTYASHAIMNGAPLVVVAKNLGHADERMVMKHYGHLADAYMSEVISKSAPKISKGRKAKKR